MKKIKTGLVIIFFGIMTTAASGNPPLKISTTHWPPYTDIENKHSPGFLVEVVRDVFALMKQDIIIRSRPWKRVQYEVEYGLADGAFAAALTDERSKYSVYPDEAIGDLIYVFFILKENKETFTFNSYSDLRDLSIGVLEGAAVNKLKEFREAGKRWKNLKPLVGEKSLLLNPLKLQSGSIDCYVDGLLPGLTTIKFLQKEEKLKKEIIPYRKKTIQETKLFLIFSKKAGFTAKHPVVLNFTKTLRVFKTSEKYKQILSRYK